MYGPIGASSLCISVSLIQEVSWPYSFSLLFPNLKIISLNFPSPKVLSVGKYSKASITVFRRDSFH